MNSELKPLFALLFGLFVSHGGPVAAHASEQGLVLLLPTGAYTAAGTLTVIASILLVTCLPRTALSRLFHPIRLGTLQREQGIRAPLVTSAMASAFLMGLAFIGLRGPTDPQSNLLPLTIWTVWWIGVFIAQGTIFDVWKWVNPWTGVAQALGLGRRPFATLPHWLAAWPAVGVLICFQIFLLADVAPSDPRRLAVVVLGYWLATLAGIEIFGAKVWLSRVECFSVLFRLIGTLRPLQRSAARDVQNPAQIQLGFPGWACFQQPPLNTSYAVFCLVALAGGSFDGVNETFWWLAQLGINPLAFPGRSAVVWSSSLGLIASILLLLGLFAFAVWIGLRAAQQRQANPSLRLGEAFNLFAITLLPIALGYHCAHYLVTFLVQIKFTLSTASDPMALGWNLLWLGGVKATVGFMSQPDTVKAIWLTQAAVVVFSHVVAVLMGHQIANTVCSNAKGAVLIQIGLTILMIAYTIFGLWLLASPRGA